MTRFALRNLTQRKTRTAVSVFAIAAQVSFVLLLIGLCIGTLREVGERIENIRSDVIVLPPGGQAVLAMSSAVMPLEPVKAALESTQGVRVAAPVVIATTNKFGSYSMVFGIEPESYRAAGRGSLELEEGEGFLGASDLLVDRRLALAEGLVLGQQVDLLNHTFTVRGIVKDGAGVRMYLPIATLQDLLGRQGKASAFFVRTLGPDVVPSVLDRLRRGPAFKGYKVIGNSEYAELLGSATFGVKEFIAAVTIMAMVFGFLIILLAMYTSIVERTRQIGILKSLGAGYLYIARSFVVEAVAMAVLGIPLGLGLAWVAKAILHAAFPTLIILFSPRWILFTSATAVVAAGLGSLYPAIRAARVDPVVALSHE